LRELNLVRGGAKARLALPRRIVTACLGGSIAQDASLNCLEKKGGFRVFRLYIDNGYLYSDVANQTIKCRIPSSIGWYMDDTARTEGVVGACHNVFLIHLSDLIARRLIEII
jgi:hypothetical protein